MQYQFTQRSTVVCHVPKKGVVCTPVVSHASIYHPQKVSTPQWARNISVRILWVDLTQTSLVIQLITFALLY